MPHALCFSNLRVNITAQHTKKAEIGRTNIISFINLGARILYIELPPKMLLVLLSQPSLQGVCGRSSGLI
jgi:hypothetical protein